MFLFGGKVKMRENLNIDTYRKKRRRKNFYKYCMYAIIAVLVLSFFALVWNFFINQRKSNSKFQIAISKWETDRLFVEEYK